MHEGMGMKMQMLFLGMRWDRMPGRGMHAEEVDLGWDLGFVRYDLHLGLLRGRRGVCEMCLLVRGR